MIDLHYWPTPNGWKVSIMLEECGPPYTLKPVNSVKAMRGCTLLEPQGKLVPFAQAVFEAYWRDDRDSSNDAIRSRS